LNRLAVFGRTGIPGWLGLPYVAVMIDHDPIRERFAALSQHLDERSRRVFAAAEAKAAGYGGIAAVWRATGIAPSTINRGLKELAEDVDPAPRQVRRPGGGRKSLVECDEQLMERCWLWSSRPSEATLSLPCVGPARACVGSQPNSARRGIGSATRWLASC
jgi:hypothetical protein